MSETHTGLVEHILPGGDGIVRHKLGDIFIPNVVSDDTVRFQIIQKRRGVLRGELLEVLEPSKHRINAPCPVATQCGGCALQPSDQAFQASLKTRWVTEAFKPVMTNKTEVVPLEVEQKSTAGRRRVRWFIDNQQLGFHKKLSHQVIHTKHCTVLSPSLDKLRSKLETHLASLPKNIQSIQAVELSNGTHIIFESEQAVLAEMQIPAIAGIQWWWRKIDTPSIKALNKPTLALFDSIQLKPYVKHPIDIQIGPNDFIQGHKQGNQTLINQVLEWASHSKRVVDLFSGCGNLSLPIAAAFGAEIIGAEANILSVQAANNNAKRLNLNAAYHTLDLFGQFKIEPFIAADTLIIDPPRKGAKRICNMIQQFFPKQIIMVNCDVASGARDAKALQQAGFKLKVLRPLDLFPLTGHVEVISLWQA
ncbi:MAG: methyltransferase [Ghiorsea sp.]